jgi:hypothetical protein
MTAAPSTLLVFCCYSRRALAASTLPLRAVAAVALAVKWKERTGTGRED